MRATSPKLRVDGAGEGSLISPEPVGRDSATEVPLLPLLLCFVAKWMLSIMWVRNRLLRKLVRLSAEPDSLGGVWFAHWNGFAVQADNQHGPLIHR